MSEPAPMEPTDPSLASAPMRIGRFELIGVLARGGMAELFLARTTGVGGFEKVLVLKRILPHFANDEEFNQMFLEEARLAGTLEHPNVVRIYDVGESETSFYFTMEYIHGEDLRKVLKAAAKAKRPIPLGPALAIAMGLCAGLHYAHEKNSYDGKPLNIVHRDVSPANLLISYQGVVKVVDFGIARANRSATITRAGQRKGKIAYMSPEQCRGEPVDRRSDIFAIGIVLYELTTLRRLFRADDEFATMNKILNLPIKPPSEARPGYPLDLERIVLRALEKNPADRWASAQELQEELDAYARGNGLDTSQRALRTYMKDLLGERPFPWDDAAQLMPLPNMSAVMPTSVDGHTPPPEGMDASGSRLLDSRQVKSVSGSPSSAGMWIGIGVGVLGIAGLAVALAMVLGNRAVPADPTPEENVAAQLPPSEPVASEPAEAEPAAPALSGEAGIDGGEAKVLPTEPANGTAEASGTGTGGDEGEIPSPEAEAEGPNTSKQGKGTKHGKGKKGGKSGKKKPGPKKTKKEKEPDADAFSIE